MEISPGEGAAITPGRPFAGLAPNNIAWYYKKFLTNLNVHKTT